MDIQKFWGYIFLIVAHLGENYGSEGIDNDDAENQIVVENDARDVQIHCLINTDGLPLSDLGLYLCPTMAQCRNDRDSYIISRIESRSVYNYYPKQYKLSLNGTLTVTKMSSKHDGMVVWCIGKVRHHGVRENTTVIQIARERPTIRVKRPQLFSVVNGMTLHLDCEATGFPPPQVIWFRIRDRKVLLNQTNDEATSLVRRNVTKDDEGGYNCTATNLLGSDRYEVQVNVIDFPSSTMSTLKERQEYQEQDSYKVITFALLPLLVLATGCLIYLGFRNGSRRSSRENASVLV